MIVWLLLFGFSVLFDCLFFCVCFCVLGGGEGVYGFPRVQRCYGFHDNTSRRIFNKYLTSPNMVIKIVRSGEKWQRIQ